MQAILGAGGSIGKELARILPRYTQRIRLVGRNPQKVNANDELFKADLTQGDEVKQALKGVEVAYLTVGLPYRLDIWQSQWPMIIRNVLAACKEHDTKLVFFDNIYMYDPNGLNGMDENTPMKPSSKKGAVREGIVKVLLNEMERGYIKALIARSADFYGPGVADNGILRQTVFERLNKSKSAQWLCSVKYKHAFTYTPDAAKATAILGNDESAYGQTWHLPTASQPFTGKEWITNIAHAMGKNPRYQVAPKFMIKMIGAFNPTMKELGEMTYQYDRDYVFNSQKFEKHYKFTPTPYQEGINAILAADYAK